MRCAVWSSQDGWGWHSEVTFPAERDLPWGSSLGAQLGSAAGEAVVGWQQIPPGTVLVPLYFREMSNNVHFHAMYVLNIVLQEELKIAAVSLLLFLCTQSIFLNCLTCGGCGTPAWTTWWYFWGYWRDVPGLRCTLPCSTQICSHVEKPIAVFQASLLQY